MPVKRYRLAVYNSRIALYGNLAAFRLIVSASSLLWVLLTAWVAATSLDSLTLISPTQEFMAKVMPISFWMAAYTIQGVVGISSMLFSITNNIVTLCDRVLGAIVWNATTVVLTIGYLYNGRHLPPIWASHIIISLIAFWLLIVSTDD